MIAILLAVWFFLVVFAVLLAIGNAISWSVVLAVWVLPGVLVFLALFAGWANDKCK